MRKGLSLVVLAFAIVFVGCASQPKGGLGKPTVMTSPPEYLESVGLGTHTKQDVLSTVGTPDKETELEGLDHWSYKLGEGYGERTFTYIFDGKTLVNVRYNDQGPHNGLTAREVQEPK